MPYKSDKIPINNEFLDRRVKLTAEDKERIVQMAANTPIRAIAREFGVHSRTIQFIVYPERHKRNLELREQRGGSMQYYDKDKFKVAMRDHRRYKHNLFLNGEIGQGKKS